MALNNRLVIILFTHTVFPEPVAPAIKRCGIVAKSAIRGSPPKSFPNANFNFEDLSIYSFVSSTSFKYTNTLFEFGISMPTVPFPGTGATILTLCAFIASAILSLKDVIL